MPSGKIVATGLFCLSSTGCHGDSDDIKVQWNMSDVCVWCVCLSGDRGFSHTTHRWFDVLRIHVVVKLTNIILTCHISRHGDNSNLTIVRTIKTTFPHFPKVVLNYTINIHVNYINYIPRDVLSNFVATRTVYSSHKQVLVGAIRHQRQLHWEEEI